VGGTVEDHCRRADGRARFGPQAIRTADYLPHDASRPHLALRVDALRDLTVLDAGDV
jgi:agmatinase